MWYDSLVAFVDAGSCNNSGVVALTGDGYVPVADFVPCVNQMLAADPSMNRFISMNDASDAILNSTISVTFIKNVDKKVQIMENSRKLSKYVPQPAFAF